MPGEEEKDAFRMPSAVLTLGLLAMGAVMACLVWEWNYYLLPQSQRPFHPEFEFFRPGGRAGLIWGVLAMTLIVFNLSYLIRRHLIGWHWLGSLRIWLSFHMMTGAIASLAVILHSTLTVSSPLATLAFWCLQLTTITGLSGIIIYLRLSLSLEEYQTNGRDPSPAVKRLIQTWRFLHRWLAILLLMVVVLHIYVSVRYGDLWIFGGPS
jgi:hypothetical protein